MTQVSRARSGRFSLDQLVEQHKMTRAMIAAQGYEPVAVKHPIAYRAERGETVWIAGEFIGDSGKFDGGCFTCGDHGFVTPDVPVGDPRHGQAEYCPKNCEAARRLRAERQQKLFASVRLPIEHHSSTLATFEARVRDVPALWQGKAMAYYAVSRFIASLALPEDGGRYEVNFADIAADLKREAFADVRTSIMLTGPYGVGKTGFEACIANAAVDAGIPTRYIRTMDALKAIQDRYGDDRRSSPPNDDFGDVESGKVIEILQRVDLLILDDFYLPNLKDDKQAKIEDIIRYRHGHRKATILSDNFEDMAALEDAWGPVISTVLGQMAHRIPIAGISMRPTPQMLGEVL